MYVPSTLRISVIILGTFSNKCVLINFFYLIFLETITYALKVCMNVCFLVAKAHKLLNRIYCSLVSAYFGP